MAHFRIRAVLFKNEDWWVAQCLEYDLATATRRLEDLPAELERLLRVQIAAGLEAGLKPFEGLPQAPIRFWKRYEEALRRGASPRRRFHVEAGLDVGATVKTLVAA